MTELALFCCFSSSLGKPHFTFLELCWQAVKIALLLAWFGGLTALPGEVGPVACGDCWGFRPLLSLAEVASCQVSLKSPYFCSHWGDWSTTALPGAHPPRRCFLPRNMERPLLGNGVRRQTSCHFRGGKFDPFVLLSASTSNSTGSPLLGPREGKKESGKCLMWVLMATNEWREMGLGGQLW